MKSVTLSIMMLAVTYWYGGQNYNNNYGYNNYGYYSQPHYSAPSFADELTLQMFRNTDRMLQQNQRRLNRSPYYYRRPAYRWNW